MTMRNKRCPLSDQKRRSEKIAVSALLGCCESNVCGYDNVGLALDFHASNGRILTPQTITSERYLQRLCLATFLDKEPLSSERKYGNISSISNTEAKDMLILFLFFFLKNAVSGQIRAVVNKLHSLSTDASKFFAKASLSPIYTPVGGCCHAGH